MRRIEWLYVTIGAICAAAAVDLASYKRYGLLPYPDATYSAWDHYRYIAMALTPFSSAKLVHWAPFCWRVLTPWLVHILPLPYHVGFYAVNFGAVVACGVLLYAWLRSLGLQPLHAAVGAGAFYSMYYGVWSLAWDYYLTDGLGMLAIVGGLYCMTLQRWGWLAFVLAVGTAGKEATLFVVPVAMVWVWQQRGIREAWRPAVAATPAVEMYFGLHIAIKSQAAYSLVYLLKHHPGLSITDGMFVHDHAFGVLWIWTLGAFGPLLPLLALPPILRRATDKLSSAWVALLPYVALLMVAASMVTNQQRTLAYLFPVIVLGAASLARSAGVASTLCLLLGAEAVAYIGMVGHLPAQSWVEAVSFAGALLAAGGMWLFPGDMRPVRV